MGKSSDEIMHRMILVCFFALICSLELLIHISRVEAQNSVCQQLADSPTLAKFVDPLPIPKQIPVNSTHEISLGAWKIKQKLHRDLPPTTLYAYGESQETATFPGPTLEATMDVTSRIHWENHIPDEEHFLTVDRSIHWANPKHGGVPMVVHMHGAETESIHDGHPDAWFTPKGEHGPAFATQHYSYPNTQRPALLWYHDHVVGITRLNVVAGLSGLYFLRSPEDKLTKEFPYGETEIPLVVKDWQFWPNGSINFPNIGDNATIHPNWCPEYFGDTVVVNGKAWPFLDIRPRVYRFRLLNGANARFFNLSLSDPSLRFHKIGTDGGYLDAKPQVVESLMLAPAERLDVLVDFSGLKPGDVVYLNNSAPAPFPEGQPSLNPIQTRSVMKFQITGSSPKSEQKQEEIELPAEAAELGSTSGGGSLAGMSSGGYLAGIGISEHLRHAELLERCVEEESALSTAAFGRDVLADAGVLHRYLRLQEFDDNSIDQNPKLSLLEERRWTDPVHERPREGSVEVWEWINTTPDAHPIHMHLIQFQVINQQPFDKQRYLHGKCNITVEFSKPDTCFTGPPIPPAIYQTGFKDTAIVWPSNVTRYHIRFQTSDGRSFPFDPTLGPGYVFHCHILDHEDNDMMRPFKVIH